MAKIYENGIKLTNVQVTEVLMNEMPSTHREIFRKTLDSNIPTSASVLPMQFWTATRFCPPPPSRKRRARSIASS